MLMKRLTYKASGVDIEKANRFVKAIKPLTAGIGGFGGFFKFDAKKYKEPCLVSSTDGVGSVTGERFTVRLKEKTIMDLPLPELSRKWRNALPSRL